ncbi:MAG: hypothetical protein JNK76_02790 [Planctomycetales bacterium]|nr:hypothetical protein [Planctomycetales bacterium]MBN8626068.1 hypothetical protein [Planctomycetota bacterium]
MAATSSLAPKNSRTSDSSAADLLAAAELDDQKALAKSDAAVSASEAPAPAGDENIDPVEQFFAALYTTLAGGLPAWTVSGDIDDAAAKKFRKQHRRSLEDLCAMAADVDPQQARAFRKLLKRATRRDGKPTTEKHGVPKPAAAYHCEAGGFSILRTDWSRGAAELAVDWSQPDLRWEFRVGKTQLFAGISSPEVSLAGKLLAVAGPWEEVCWESNVDVDYLELEIALEAGVRLQRQFVLTRRDGLLYVADAVLMPAASEVSAVLRVPVAGGVDILATEETRELLLCAGKQRALVIPPLCGEWRTDRRGGELGCTEGELQLTATLPQARALYLPLVVVYDRKRAKRECTWRRLTVGEDLQLVAADKAAGFRIQIGDEHWLGYRSLTERANRTVFGVNLQTNFLLSRFTTEGESEPLVEIDH